MVSQLVKTPGDVQACGSGETRCERVCPLAVSVLYHYRACDCTRQVRPACPGWIERFAA